FRPLVFIPGILGTELLDEDNNVIWGGASSLRNFEKLEIGGQSPVRLHPGGLVETVNVLGPFWTIHQYDSLLTLLHGLNYQEGKNFFIFTYDWSQSNFDSAIELKALIDSDPNLRGKDIDILAHSMGGLIAQIFLRQNADAAAHIKRLIGLGIPNRGSMNA